MSLSFGGQSIGDGGFLDPKDATKTSARQSSGGPASECRGQGPDPILWSKDRCVSSLLTAIATWPSRLVRRWSAWPPVRASPRNPAEACPTRLIKHLVRGALTQLDV
jgi:hypothetical protein